MLKKDASTRQRHTLNLKCGDCMHFKGHAKFEKPCAELGTKTFADAPDCFTPNVFALSKKNPHAFHQIGLMLHDFTPSEARILLATIRQTAHARKKSDLDFGQPVYFRVGNTDFLSNYFRGFVAGVSLHEDEIYITSDLNGTQRKRPLIATLMRDSVFTITAFKKKRSQLAKAKKVNDPKPLWTAQPKIDDPLAYEPPSMETVPAEWFESKAERGRKPKKVSEMFDPKVKLKPKANKGKAKASEFTVRGQGGKAKGR